MAAVPDTPDPVDLARARRRGVICEEWLGTDHPGRLDADEESLEAARAFVLERWRERAAERGGTVPPDLSGGCMLAAMFVKAVFGGSIQGNYDHVHNVVDGRVVDLSRDSADVRALSDPYEHDPDFMGEPDFHENLVSWTYRLEGWVDAFLAQATAPRP